MEILKTELEKIKEELLSGFKDPLENNELERFLVGASKYVRSTLALLYIKSFGLEVNSDVIKILSIGEIIHNASLLQDDVIDDAEKRRGNLTIGKKYSSKLAILSGDYLLLLAMKKLLDLGNSEIIEYFRLCAEKMTTSEIQQFFFRNKSISKEEYLKICEEKTALLFSVILKSCAITLGVDDRKASEFGRLFGMIFQINNDLEKTSAQQDRLNGISTAKDILGIENTRILLDNYQGELKLLLKECSNNSYKKRLEDLISYYVK